MLESMYQGILIGLKYGIAMVTCLWIITVSCLVIYGSLHRDEIRKYYRNSKNRSNEE